MEMTANTRVSRSISLQQRSCSTTVEARHDRTLSYAVPPPNLPPLRRPCHLSPSTGRPAGQLPIQAPFHAHEEELLHDLQQHLRRGAIYDANQFLLRAKSWWSAECGRWWSHHHHHHHHHHHKKPKPAGTRRQQPSRAAKTRTRAVQRQAAASQHRQGAGGAKKPSAAATARRARAAAQARGGDEAHALLGARGSDRGDYCFSRDCAWAALGAAEMTPERAHAERERFFDRLVGEMAPLMSLHADDAKSIVEMAGRGLGRMCLCELGEPSSTSRSLLDEAAVSRVAPCAEMEISPTLGNWPTDNAGPWRKGLVMDRVKTFSMDGLDFAVDGSGRVMML
ncbi:hypothetical protein P8C59_009365 [Phyllachora maydis]|uniref:Uncharacterized protein n=1 Tax=Phyllachora maydis TaxID=1825666 RepID=A0AAD9IDK2_9PEZI|nr:hypothetical protein P8C59_009365 [Phyllachora maydis]